MAADSSATDTGKTSVFISYNHIDNTPPKTKPKVGTFVRQLFQDLDFELTRLGLPKDAMWLDFKIKQAEDFTEIIRDALLQSDILLAIVSRQYVQSNFCAREIATFVERLNALPEEERKRRIFRVDKQEVPNERLPPALQNIQAARFYRTENGQDIEFFNPWKGVGNTKYLQELQKLARAIYERWQELNKDSPLYLTGDAAPLPGRDPGSEPVGASAMPVPDLGLAAAKSSVFVAKPAADMEDEYDTLVRELQGRGFAVLPDPESQLPDEGSAAIEAMRQALAGADLSIHLIGEGPGVTPSGLNDGIVALQLAEAGAVAEQRKFARLFWVPKIFRGPEAENGTFEPDGLQPRDPFKVLERFGQDRPLASDEIESDTASRFNEFVLQRLTPRTGPAAVPTKTWIYVGALLPTDQGLLTGMVKRIKALGANACFGPSTLLAKADHAVFCWGQADEVGMFEALDAPVLQTWRANHPAGQLCLVLFPPMTDTKASALEIGSYGEADCVVDSNSDELEAQLRLIISGK
jgi:hypothetical protein